MVRGLISFFSVVLLAGGVMALQQEAAPSAPDMTSPKAYLKGCVGCHEGDHGLGATLAETHGDALKQVKNVPSDCAKCHKPGSKLLPMNTLMHKIHYGKGEQSFFATGFGGQCLHCHKMDASNGKVTLKSAPRNW